MKILQLIQKPQLRGAEIFACQLSNHLMEQGHEVVMVCLVEGSAQLPFKGKLIHLNRPLNKRLIDVKGWKQLAAVIEEHKPDILQANAGDTLKFAVFSKLVSRWTTPIIFRNANKVSDFIDSRIKWYFNSFLVKQVAHIISVSELCRLDFLKTYGIPEDNVTTIPIGLELKPVDNQLPADLTSFLADGKIVVNVGSFVPEKNHVGLVRIVKQLVDQGVNIKLLLIGDGRLRNEIQDLITKLELEKHILLMGYRTDVLSIMAHAHVFVLPSLIEGLPAVILEAFYCRTPVVTYDVGGISEVVKNGITGWLVKAGDEPGFVKAIHEALSDPHETIIENAYQWVITDFDNQKITTRFITTYTSILNTLS